MRIWRLFFAILLDCNLLFFGNTGGSRFCSSSSICHRFKSSGFFFPSRSGSYLMTFKKGKAHVCTTLPMEVIDHVYFTILFPPPTDLCTIYWPSNIAEPTCFPAVAIEALSSKILSAFPICTLDTLLLAIQITFPSNEFITCTLLRACGIEPGKIRSPWCVEIISRTFADRQFMAIPAQVINLVLFELIKTRQRRARKYGRIVCSRDNFIDPCFPQKPKRSTRERKQASLVHEGS